MTHAGANNLIPGQLNIGSYKSILGTDLLQTVSILSNMIQQALNLRIPGQLNIARYKSYLGTDFVTNCVHIAKRDTASTLRIAHASFQHAIHTAILPPSKQVKQVMTV